MAAGLSLGNPNVQSERQLLLGELVVNHCGKAAYRGVHPVPVHEALGTAEHVVMDEGGTHRHHNPQDERQKGAHTHSPSIGMAAMVDRNCGSTKFGIASSSYLRFSLASTSTCASAAKFGKTSMQAGVSARRSRAIRPASRRDAGRHRDLSTSELSSDAATTS